MSVNKWLKEMTLNEKLTFLSGKDFWHTVEVKRLGIPSIMVTDGPHGLRKQTSDSEQLGTADSVPAISYPTAVTMASSWDETLLEGVAKRMGNHAKHEGIAVVLGPGVNIKRSPLCGRNFEYFSEDPLLAGKMATAWIKGIESTGVGSSIKHYALNNQETRRMTLDVYADQRAMHEIYLEPFRYAIQYGKPLTLMAAYNKINGQYACENEYLLNTLLRKKWKYNGLVVSDWGAMNDPVKSLNAGLDLEMPSSHGMYVKQLKKALKNGSLKIKTVDEHVRRILTMVEKTMHNVSSETYDFTTDENFAKKVAKESMVLLKNQKQKLPLKNNTSVTLIGSLADQMRYQGAGSSRINPTKITSLLNAFEMSEYTFSYHQGYTLEDQNNQTLIDEAIEASKKQDVVVLCAGLTESYESEGFDRTHLNLPNNQIALIEALSKVNKPCILVLFGGSPVAMPWEKHIDTILNAYLPGQEGGSAILELLYGKENPSGKLAESYPLDLASTALKEPFKKIDQALYKESIFVGYRYYDTARKEVLYPFGHGLSYTNFHYNDLTLSKTKATEKDKLVLTFNLTNTGTHFGKEVVQVYVSMLDSKIYREKQALKAYQKVALKPQETKQISMTLRPKDFMYYNPNIEDFSLENGTYEIRVGASSRDIRLKAEVKLRNTGKSVIIPREYKTLTSYFDLSNEQHQFKDEDFKTLYGRSIPEPSLESKVTLNTAIGDLNAYRLGRRLNKMLEKNTRTQEIEDETTRRMMEHVFRDLPLRSLAAMSEGKLTLTTTQGFVDVMNGKRLRGYLKIIKGTVRKR